MKVAPKQPSRNVEAIIRGIELAKKEGIELIVFPEMAVPGYLIGDLYDDESFIHDVESYTSDIVQATQGIAVAFGTLSTNQGKVNRDGRIRKYNSAVIAQDGELLRTVHKTLHPNYRYFDDSRYFHPSGELAREMGFELSNFLYPTKLNLEGKKVSVGFMLCEDMWQADYLDNPGKSLVKNGAEILVNLSCSPWGWRKNDKRHRVVKELLGDLGRPLIYVNNVGVQNNGKNIITFDGASTVYDSSGRVVLQATPWEEEVVVFDRALASLYGNNEELERPALDEHQELTEIYKSITLGLGEFFRGNNITRAVIGLSGGIDSAVVACLLEQALGAKNVYAINMPSKFNSQSTINAAEEVAKALGINYATLPITDSVELTAKELTYLKFERSEFQGELTSFMLENVQARDRGSRILAGLAAKLGGIFTNNGNKTEMSLGYSTLYGDVSGAIAPIGDLWKGQVYALARFLNNEVYRRDVIPGSIISGHPDFSIVPSAELSAEQNVDEGKGDPINYPYHDALLRELVEYRKNPETVLHSYIEGTLDETLRIPKGTVAGSFANAKEFVDDLEQKYHALQTSLFKRVQAPPVIVVSKSSFGYDFRESLGVADFTRKYIELKAEALK